MTEKIKFDHVIDYGFTGRNGTFISSGLVVDNHTPASMNITIHPITSKDHIGKCHIDIPKNKIDELIHLLEMSK